MITVTAAARQIHGNFFVAIDSVRIMNALCLEQEVASGPMA